MENNQSFVARIGNFEKIEGADKIIKASVILNGTPVTSVVVGLTDYKEGDLVVYFDSNLCLSDTTVLDIDRQSPDFTKEGFNSIARYLARGNRVRCIKLRSTYSDGLTIPADKFYIFFKNEKEAIKTLVEGFSFTEIDGIEICHKYVVPVKSQSQGTGKKRNREKNQIAIVSGHFPEHCDTEQLARNIRKIDPNDVIQITRKMHGTSSRTGNVLISRNISFVEKVFKKLGFKISSTQYEYAYGSRRVTKKIEEVDLPPKQHYYSYDLWTDAGEKFFKGKLAKGEVVYYEIVGWIPNGSAIQSIKDHVYNYGAPENTFRIFVYRFTLTSEDGFTIEYSTQQVRERCAQLGVDCVEQYFYGFAKDKYPEIATDENWHTNFAERLKVDYLEKDALDCISKDTADEGIVLRREVFNCDSFKMKSLRFLDRESKEMEKEDYADIEATPEVEVQMPQKG